VMRLKEEPTAMLVLTSNDLYDCGC